MESESFGPMAADEESSSSDVESPPLGSVSI